jgi:hypothetical protein
MSILDLAGKIAIVFCDHQSNEFLLFSLEVECGLKVRIGVAKLILIKSVDAKIGLKIRLFISGYR